jgi:hypothetical protein
MLYLNLNRMKLRHSLSLIFFVFISISGFGQMMPVTTTIKTPYGNVPHTYFVPSPNHYYGQQNISGKYEFRVVLNNDSTFVTKTRINLSQKEDNSITVKQKHGKTQIFPNDTKYIMRVTFDNKILKGIPADSCWLFKVVQGEINGYSFLAEEMEMYVIAIQAGDDGPIVPLTKENLMPLVVSEKKAYELAKKNKLHRALNRYNTQAKLSIGKGSSN